MLDIQLMLRASARACHVAALPKKRPKRSKLAGSPMSLLEGLAPFPGKAGEWKSVGKVLQEVVCMLDALKQANLNPLQVSKQLP